MTLVAAPAGGATLDQIKKQLFAEVIKQAGAIASAKGMKNIVAVDQGLTGALPWFYNNGGNFNENTFQWLNHVWKYNADGFMETDGSDFTTALYNILQSIKYELDPKSQAAINQANTTNAVILNTVLQNYTGTFGPFPSNLTTPAQKIAFVEKEVLSWAATGVVITLSQLQSAVNPAALLPNMPLAAGGFLPSFIQYLTGMNAVLHLQQITLSHNNQVEAMINNLTSALPVTSAGNGWMQTQDENGNIFFQPEISVSPATSMIQNALTGKGNGFKVSMNMNKVDSHTAKLSVGGGLGFNVPILDVMTFGLKGGVKYDTFSVDTTTTDCTIEVSFDGVTTFTPQPLAYNISQNYGWWDPSVIKDALNHVAGTSGYTFGATPPPYNFKVDGDFGFIKNLLISNPPTITITYNNADYNSISKALAGTASTQLDFLGLGFVKASGSYYKSDVQKTSAGTGVVITMAPDLTVAPVAPLLQDAYVIGADIIWPGA